jgi:hypothetical protein
MKQATKATTIPTGMTTDPGLPPGTRVQLKDGVKHKGTVMPHMRETSLGLLGLFPVRLDNWIWQTCNASDVIVLELKDTD